MVITSNTNKNFPLFGWLCIWTVGGIFAITRLLFLLRGKELISIGNGDLGIKQYDGLFEKEKVYDLNECKTFSVQDDSKGGFGSTGYYSRYKYIGGTFVFYHGAQIVRFGRHVSEQEANDILDLLKNKKILTDKNF